MLIGELFQKDINRLYIGNEFCHNLFPEVKLLMNMLENPRPANDEMKNLMSLLDED